MTSEVEILTEGPAPRTATVLDRHDERRRAGVPTVSVLAGPIGPALEAAHRWAAEIERPTVLFCREPADAQGLVAPWVDRLSSGRDLVDAAVAWLAARRNQPAGLLGRSLRNMSAHEVAMLLDSTVPLVSETGVELAVCRLVELAADGRRGSAPGLAAELNDRLDGRGRPWLRVFKALGELVPQECLPILLVALSGKGRDVARMEGVARRLAELAEAQPRATVALIVGPEAFDAYLDQAPASRAKALLRGSIVAIREPDPIDTDDRPAPLSTARSSLPTTPDDARSAAERFLFDLLDALPETAGLFELNATLDFHFGPGRPIEVDLVARSLKLVIEIDGYYHFQGPEAYRRDRRKDLELQKRNYVVLRILADDVVDRLEELLETLLSAVAFCRHRLEAR